MNALLAAILAFILPIHGDEYFRYSGYDDLITEDANRRHMESAWSKLSKADLSSRIIYHLGHMNLEDGSCRNQSLAYFDAFRNETLWAVQMHDSAAQSLEGLIAGNNYHMGNFDECLDIKLPVFGQYCLTKLEIHLNLAPLRFSTNKLNSKIFLGNFTKPDDGNPFISAWDRVKLSPDPSKFRRDVVFWAVCVPASCSNHDIESALVRELLLIGSETGLNVTGHLDPKLCQTQKSLQVGLTKGDVLFSVLAGLLIFLTFGSSVLDYLFNITLDDTSSVTTKLLLCFSAKRNLINLSCGDLAGTGFDAIHGLRLLFMCFAIAGHRFMLNFGGPVMNVKVAEDGYMEPANMYMMNGMIVVDTFFVYSGCLTAYYLPLELDKQYINPFMIWIYRFVRLTPVYLIILIFHATLLEHLGYGPLWPITIGLEARRCETYWWTNLLYLNNYIHPGDMCMFQTWYLAVDTHLFMIAVVVVYLMWKSPKIGYTTFALTAVVSLVIPFWITYYYKADALMLLYRSAFEDPVGGEYFQLMYAATHMRAGPYVVGVAVGFLLYKLKNIDFELPTFAKYAGHILAAAICIVAQFGGFVFYEPFRPYDAFESAAYNALHRTAWGVGMALNIFLLVRGKIDWIHRLLTWAPLVPVSRLTYCAYLFHTVTHLYELGTLRVPKFNTYYNGIWMFIGDLISTFAFSLLLNLTVEAPFRAIEKSMLGARPKKTTSENQLELSSSEKRDKN